MTITKSVPVRMVAIDVDESAVPCTYCRVTVIPAESFAFLSDTERLLTAACPSCDRRTTILAETWRAHGGELPHTLRLLT